MADQTALSFIKMHGAGNDFVILDARAAPLPLQAGQIAALADRHTGIGCDQIITLEPAANADLFMRIHNPDGSEAGACGNATRCVAALVLAETGHSAARIATLSGILPAQVMEDGRVQVDMGAPRMGWQDIPLAQAADTLALNLGADHLGAHPGLGLAAGVSMGNPHATFFVPDIDALDISRLGPALEQHALFPDRANIGFAQILGPDRIRLRVWERGAGLTRACGSGACAAAVNAHRRNLANRRAMLVLDGGVLEIDWRESDGHVLMTGPVAIAFRGQTNLAAA